MSNLASHLRRSAIHRYGAAVLGVVLATGLRSLLTPYVGTRLPFLPYFFAVIPVAWHLGVGPSLVAIGLSAVITATYFLPMLAWGNPNAITDLIGLVLFIAVNLVIVWFAEANRIARRRLELEVAERVRAEATIIEQVHRAEFARDIGLALTSNPTLAGALAACVELTIRHLGGDRARIALVEEAGHDLEPPVQEPDELSHGLMGRIATDRRAYFSNNLIDDSGLVDASWVGRDAMTALAGCPLIVDGRLVGVWVLCARHSLRSETLVALESVASSLALGIERMRAEENLRVEEARKTAILETSLDAIITMNHEGRVLEFNPAAERIFGITAAAIHGQDLAEHLMLPQIRQPQGQGLAHDLATGEGPILNRRIELQARRADGSEFPAEISVARIPIAGPPLFTAHIRDISDRVLAEAALRSAKQEAEEANQAKDRFIAVLSHELRTPLNPISLTINSILGKTEESNELRHDLELIRHYVGFEARLIDDLLDVMRIVRGKLPLRVESTDVHRLVEQAVAICDAELDARSLHLTLDLQADRHHVQGDPNRLRQVFWNLIKNAVKFTPIGGSITIRSRNEPIAGAPRCQNEPNPGSGTWPNEPIADSTRRPNEPTNASQTRPNEPIADSTRRPNEPIIASQTRPNEPIADSTRRPNEPTMQFQPDELVIEVADTGIGIAADVLPRIFEAFQQGDASVTRQFGGLGLGLAICNGVIEGHHGSLTAQSDGEGRGTTFTVRLSSPLPGSRAATTIEPFDPTTLVMSSPRPLTTHFAPSVVLPDPTSGPPKSPTRLLRVLVVEDEPATIRLMVRLLRGLGYEVKSAESVVEATEWVNGSEPFDLIVSDIGLPDGTGFDLMRQVRATRAGTPGIALTGYGTDDDIEQSRLAGFAAHMTKPIDFGQLENLIRLVVPTTLHAP